MNFTHDKHSLPLGDRKAFGEEQAMFSRGVKPSFVNARQGDPEPLSLHPVRCAILLPFDQGCRPGPAERPH